MNESLVKNWKRFIMNEQIKSDPTQNYYSLNVSKIIFNPPAISVEGRVNDSMVLQEILKNDE